MEQPGDGDIMTELFQRVVMREANMALMFLGRVPHPETGETLRDLAAAKDYVDQLEMFEHKTRGNLSETEEALLRKSIAATRTALASEMEAAGVALQNEGRGDS